MSEAKKTNSQKTNGTIVKVTGSVVDVEFDEQNLPNIFDELTTQYNG